MKFVYRAKTQKGETQEGTVEASSKEAALNLLQKYGLYITYLEKYRVPFYTQQLKFFERVSQKDIVIFSRELSIMFNSRIPLVEALYVLANQISKSTFREIIFKLAEEVEGGTAFSNALSLYPHLFTPFYVSMVKSGEASGKLAEILTYLADHLEREHDFRSKIQAATIYPILVLVVFVCIFAGMIVFVLPRLSEVLRESGEELPAITEIVLSSADFFQHWGLPILVIFSILLIAVYRGSKTTKGKALTDKISLKIPYFNNFLKKLYLSRLAENLSTLISGGLPITQALDITSDIVGNNVYQEIIFDTRKEVEKGESISTVFKSYPEYIPPFVSQMILVGEKTGQLGMTLKNVVSFYQKEVNRGLEQMVSLLEPLLILFLGVIVGVLAIAVLMPIYRLGMSM